MGRILLVRHGQASWDSDDYDVLSSVGREQGRLLGASLAARGVVPDRIIAGGMQRHRDTATEFLTGLRTDLAVAVDARWNEYDHVEMLGKVTRPFAAQRPTAAEFQTWVEHATDRWTAGSHHDYTEPFDAFTTRVEAALQPVAELPGTTVVITSGGPIAHLVAQLTDGGTPAWRRLNVVCVNTGVTMLVTGRRGTTLVTFNEHSHLGDALRTYR